jgi:2'-5' RNA ligase
MPMPPTSEDPVLFDVPETSRSRFLLVIEPTVEVNATVLAWKQTLRERIGGYSGSRSIPHITLFYADLPDAYEADVRTGVARGCVGQQPFTLHLNGITHFPDKRTIFIDPVETTTIAEARIRVVEQVRAFPHVR